METEVRRNFRWMALCFAVNHSCATTPLVFASSVLDAKVGFMGNGALYASSVISSLLLSVLAVDQVGLKGGLILGTALYTIYVGCFTVAAFFIEFIAIQYPLFVAGSVCCGLAAGILWTAEGGYMAHSATMLADSGISREAATSELAGEFAFYYLVLEVIGKLAFSFLQRLGLEVWHIGGLYTFISLAAMLLLCGIDKVARSGEEDADGQARGRGSTFAKLLATVRLWRDPKIWLLSPTNITFGFSAAYLNGYFNAVYEAPELGTQALGLLCACTVGCAAVFAKVYGWLGKTYGKGVPITVGALSFACIPILVLSTNCCKGFGWWMLIFYVLQGSGRAVYESTNKAVFSDFFPGEDTEAAFSNCAMQMSVASAILFFNSGKIDGKHLAIMVMISAAMTPLVYALTTFLKANEATPQDRGEDVPIMSRVEEDARE